VNVLSLILFIPLIGAAITLFTKSREQARMVALVSSAVPLILTAMAYLEFNSGLAFLKFQFVEKISWISSLGINYYLGVDGISMPLILLNATSSLH
jgi:NADH:ubiquinone oxidoreductase subunit 4 (subunit M)